MRIEPREKFSRTPKLFVRGSTAYHSGGTCRQMLRLLAALVDRDADREARRVRHEPLPTPGIVSNVADEEKRTMDELINKVERTMKLALRRRRKGCLAIVEVANPREAEMILELIGGREIPHLRERIHAIALLEPSGLHIKRVDEDWQPLKELSAPAVLLCPPGILSEVLADDRIKRRYLVVSRDSSQRNRGCAIGCLILVAIVVVRIIIKLIYG